MEHDEHLQAVIDNWNESEVEVNLRSEKLMSSLSYRKTTLRCAIWTCGFLACTN